MILVRTVADAPRILDIRIEPRLPDGERVCYGSDGCGALVYGVESHLRWHRQLQGALNAQADNLDYLKNEISSVSTGALKYDHVHAGEKPGVTKGTDDSDSRQASAESDLGGHEGVDSPLR